MITRILLFGLIIAGLSSCATYRTGQTPDDVYYSPEREGASYVQTDRDEDGRTSYNENNEDRRIRQQIHDQRFRSFDDDYYWNSPRYNSWGWNTWNNPYNTWGWNNSWGMNYGWGNNRWKNPYYGGYNNFVCIPGSHSVIIIGGYGAPRNSTGIRYSPTIQRFNTTNTSNGKFVNTGNGSRYFGGSNNNGGGRRTGFFGGGSNNNTYSGSSGSGSRTFGNSGSSSGSGSRTFSGGSGNSSSGSSGSSSSGSKSSAGGRRN